jgi:hypothetical protein
MSLISGQNSWLHIQRSWFDSRRYQIFWEVVGLKQGSLSIASTIEELFGRISSGSGLEIREYGRRDPSRWPRGTLYPQKLTLSKPTSCGRSVGIVRSRTQATELNLSFNVALEYGILMGQGTQDGVKLTGTSRLSSVRGDADNLLREIWKGRRMNCIRRQKENWYIIECTWNGGVSELMSRH